MSVVTSEDIQQVVDRAKAATGDYWYAVDGENTWQLFAGWNGESELVRDEEGRIVSFPNIRIHPQLIKAPKRGTPYAEYWPNRADEEFITHAKQDVLFLADVLASRTALCEMMANLMDLQLTEIKKLVNEALFEHHINRPDHAKEILYELMGRLNNPPELNNA